MFNLDMLIGRFSLMLLNNASNTKPEPEEPEVVPEVVEDIETDVAADVEIPDDFFDTTAPKTNLETSNRLSKRLREYIKYCDDSTRETLDVVERHIDVIKEKAYSRYKKRHKNDMDDFTFDMKDIR